MTSIYFASALDFGGEGAATALLEPPGHEDETDLSASLRRTIAALEGVSEERSCLSGVCSFHVGQRPFARLQEGEHELDLRLPREVLRVAGADPRAVTRAVRSEWMLFRFRRPEDVAEAARLARLAWESARDA